MTNQDPNWFQKKWGFPNPTPGDVIYQKLEELEDRVKILEEENVELTNELYRMENSLDARIDILAERCRINYDV
jgi:cell division protein FtsB